MNVTFRDYSQLTEDQVSFTVQLREKYLTDRKNKNIPKDQRMTLQDMESELNRKFNLDKSIRAYRRVWESKGVN